MTTTYNFLIKLFALILFIISVGVPINNIFNTILVTLFVIYLVYATIDSGKIKKFLPVILVLIGISILLPNPKIYEQHNIYLPPDGNKHTPYELLSQEVHDIFNQRFLQYHLRKNWQDDKVYGTWRYFPKTKDFDISADGVWGKKYLIENNLSRVVNDIDFNNIQEFRATFIDRYNWYDWRSQLKRKSMPFFVGYTFDEDYIGSELVFSGDIVLEQDGNYKHVTKGSIEFDQDNINTKIWGLSLQNNLSIKLNKSNYLSVISFIEQVIPIVVLGLLLLIFIVDFNRNILYIFGVSIISILVLLFKFPPEFFEGFITTIGGMDGNVYHRYALSILDGFYDNNISQILRGGQDIFYFMPGMGYFIFLSYFIFGQNSLFLILLFSLNLIGLYKLLNIYIKDYIAIVLVFLISLSSSYLYLLHGYQPEILSITFFAFAFYVTSKYLNNQLNGNYLYLIGFLYVLSIFLRPNMIIPIGLIYLFIIFTLRNKETFIKLSVGFLPLSLITLHNYIYGGKFVLLTSSAFIPANYHVHFDWYFKMFYDDTILQKVLEQIAKWSHDYNILLLLVFAVLLFAVFTFRRYSNDIKLLILASLGSQLPLFFWHASGRYSYLAWLLSFVLCISIIHFYIQKYKQSHNTQKKKTHTKRKHTKKRKK